MHTAATYDRAAIALSSACVAHCVALPTLAIVLPFVGFAAEAEWVHWLLTGLAIGASGMVIVTAQNARVPSFYVPALVGVSLVSAALFAESFGVDETPLTVIGGTLLAAAHIYRIFKHN
ncbi:MerC domain-containing protein [Erythrobacter sp. W53]|uniref:MerC domain-containing protein n=1 Tax=Erythrobacter sp. W53 TaxID=3425947 RepID=UPI003D76A333